MKRALKELRAGRRSPRGANARFVRAPTRAMTHPLRPRRYRQSSVGRKLARRVRPRRRGPCRRQATRGCGRRFWSAVGRLRSGCSVARSSTSSKIRNARRSCRTISIALSARSRSSSSSAFSRTGASNSRAIDPCRARSETSVSANENAAAAGLRGSAKPTDLRAAERCVFTSAMSENESSRSPSNRTGRHEGGRKIPKGPV